MKRVDPRDYLDRIKRKFNLDPLYELNLDLIEEQPEEYDRRIEIAKLFIPEIADVGQYDIRFDLAATMVAMSLPFDKRSLVTDYLSAHYKILSFYPWNLDCLEDWVYTEKNYYHPGSPILVFSHPLRPKARIEDFTELLKGLRIFHDIKLTFDQFMSLYYYYAWKSTMFKMSSTEIDILNSTLPYYSKNIEELNFFLEDLYTKEKPKTKTPKYVKELVDKLGRDYKTVKKYLDELKSQKLLHQVLWLDLRYIGMETLSFLLPEKPTIHIRSGYYNRKYMMKSAKEDLTIFSSLVPLKYHEKMRRYVETALKMPVKAYSVFNIPIVPFSFRFYNKQENKFIMDWGEVNNHFEKCEFRDNEKRYEPVRAPRGNIDTLTLKIIEFLSGNATISDQFLRETLKASHQRIKDRRVEIEKHGIRWPFIFSSDWPELYFFKANISNIGEMNYCIELMSIFPFVFYNWCQNIHDSKDCFLLCFINLPIGSFNAMSSYGKNKLPFEYEFYYGSVMSYAPTFSRSWEMFDEEKKEYKYDFSKIRITVVD